MLRGSSVALLRPDGASLDILRPHPYSRPIGEYIVTLHGTEIRVDVVEADSAIEAAKLLSVEEEDPRGSIYSVQPFVRVEFPVRVTI